MKFIHNWVVRYSKPYIEEELKNNPTDQLRQWAIDYAFNSQQIPKEEVFAKMHFSFMDSQGRKYYTWYDKFDMPNARAEQLQIILQEIAARVDRDTLQDWVDATKKITMEDKDKKTIVLNVIRMLDALESRMEISFDEDLLMKLACVIYICEDQDPRVWNEQYEQNKFKFLKEDANTGLYDFFHMGGLTQFMPGLVESQNAYQKFAIQAELEKKRFKKMTDHLNSPETVKQRTSSDTGTRQESTTGNKLKKESA